MNVPNVDTLCIEKDMACAAAAKSRVEAFLRAPAMIHVGESDERFEMNPNATGIRKRRFEQFLGL